MRFGLLAAALFTLVCGSAIAEMVDNPAYKMWAKYKPDTQVSYTQEMSGGGHNMTMNMTNKLVEVTDDNVTVEMSMSSSMMPMAMPPRKTVHPAKVEQEKATPTQMPPGFKGEVKPLGQETVEIDGTKYDCQVFQFSGEGQGQKMEGKTWTCKDIPGGMVKMESTGTGQQSMSMKMTLVKAEVKQ